MPRPSLGTRVADFANLFKAFIGSNYLSIAFAFSLSGFVMGIVGLSMVAMATCHCCLLIVTCKHLTIESIVNTHKARKSSAVGSLRSHGSQSYSEESDSDSEDTEVSEMRRKMLAFMTYPDIAEVVLGRFGRWIVVTCLFFTQYGFCTAYFIFVGNTLRDLIEITCLQIPQVHGVILNCSAHLNVTNTSSSWLSLPENSSGIIVPGAHMVEYSPVALPLLVLTPVALFILFIFIKNVRTMGTLSAIANLSITAGCIAVGVCLVTKVSSIGSHSILLFRLEGLPIFFGMVTGSFEGIGTIIPIESSMADNRHNFRKFLMLAVFGVYAILMFFGIFGYLEYGGSTAQMLNANVASKSGYLGLSINILLIVGVLLTFPLQIYPVMEIAEKALFAEGKLLGPRKKCDDPESVNSSGSSDQQSLLEKPTVQIPFEIAVEIPSSVSAWKRYLLRGLLVCTAAGIAVLARNFFAYVTAVVGSTGSVLLAYVFPCLLHFLLTSQQSSIAVKIKDILLIGIASVGGVSCLVLTIMKIVNDDPNA